MRRNRDRENKIETKTELLCAQLLESELRIKDISKKLLEMETDLRKLNIEYKSIFWDTQIL